MWSSIVLKRSSSNRTAAAAIASDSSRQSASASPRHSAERGGELALRGLDVADPHRSPSGLGVALEHDGIDRVGVDLHEVARLAGEEGTGHAGGLQDPAHPCNVALHRLQRGRRRILTPQPLDELPGRDDLVGAQRKKRQQQTVLGRTEADRTTGAR